MNEATDFETEEEQTFREPTKVERRTDANRRLLITLGLVTAVIIAGRVPRPFLNLQEAGNFFGPDFLSGPLGSMFGLGALGITPLVSAFVTVEAFAYLVPAWSPLRFEDRGRKKLERWSHWLSLVFAAFQSLGTALYMESLEATGAPALVPIPGWTHRGATALTLVGFTAALLLVAKTIDGGLPRAPKGVPSRRCHSPAFRSGAIGVNRFG